jgi:class 3 adenylate cyclase
MARFARDCMQQTRVLTKKLEVTLGPDTADLAMRMGIHSGAVTAGVLRGARSRFQLFGDTMNTAARMESTGIRNKIQISQEFADLLVVAGKTNWISRREDGEFVISIVFSMPFTSPHLSFLLPYSHCSGICQRQR